MSESFDKSIFKADDDQTKIENDSKKDVVSEKPAGEERLYGNLDTKSVPEEELSSTNNIAEEALEKTLKPSPYPEYNPDISAQTEEPEKPIGERTLYGNLDIPEPTNVMEDSPGNELESPELETKQAEQLSETEPSENEELQTEKAEDEIKELESKVEQAQEALEAAYAGIDESQMEAVSDDMENPESSPEFQAYVKEMKDRMEKEFEGLDSFDRNAEATERPKRTGLKKAMLIATAGVMLWMASAAAAPDTAAAKSSFGIESVFKDQKAIEKEKARLERERAREKKRAEKRIENQQRKMIKNMQKGVSNIATTAVKEVLRNIFN